MHRKVVNIFMYVNDLFHILLSCDRLMDPWNICRHMNEQGTLNFTVIYYVMKSKGLIIPYQF